MLSLRRLLGSHAERASGEAREQGRLQIAPGSGARLFGPAVDSELEQRRLFGFGKSRALFNSGEIWGRVGHPDDLSRCATEDEFVEKLTVALKNQRHATRAGGYYGAIIGDLRRGGAAGQTTILVVVRQPQVQQKVRVQDFERWLESQGRTPAEVSVKGRLREPLGYEIAPTASATTRNRNR